VSAVRHFHWALSGQQFTVVSDAAALRTLMTSKTLSAKLNHWALYLQGYNFAIEHRPGKTNTFADGLSRLEETAAPEGETMGAEVSGTATYFPAVQPMQQEQTQAAGVRQRMGDPAAGRDAPALADRRDLGPTALHAMTEASPWTNLSEGLQRLDAWAATGPGGLWPLSDGEMEDLDKLLDAYLSEEAQQLRSRLSISEEAREQLCNSSAAGLQEVAQLRLTVSALQEANQRVTTSARTDIQQRLVLARERDTALGDLQGRTEERDRAVSQLAERTAQRDAALMQWTGGYEYGSSMRR
jgi:hypothetical protein